MIIYTTHYMDWPISLFLAKYMLYVYVTLMLGLGQDIFPGTDLLVGLLILSYDRWVRFEWIDLIGQNHRP